MHMRTAADPGTSNLRQHGTRSHTLSCEHEQLRIVRVHRHPTPGMNEHHDLAVSAQLFSRVRHDPRRRRAHIPSNAPADVDRLVIPAFAASKSPHKPPARQRPAKRSWETRSSRRTNPLRLHAAVQKLPRRSARSKTKPTRRALRATLSRARSLRCLTSASCLGRAMGSGLSLRLRRPATSEHAQKKRERHPPSEHAEG